jgi:hypothetical protein
MDFKPHPKLSEEVLKGIAERLKANGYNFS